MSVNSRIILNHLCYATPDKPLFSELSLSFLPEKYGVIGRNGVGKSTLLKLIVGELLPTAGSIQTEGKISFFSQETLNRPDVSVAAALGIAEKLQALQRINQGSIDEQDYAIVGDDWLLQEKTQQQMQAFSLQNITLDRPLASLSGGEQTRLFLVKAFLSGADYLILDEPTNNLDSSARQALYQAIINWPHGLIIASHDRELLNLMDKIIEISPLGVHIYGGNYEHYHQQKELEKNAAAQTLQTAKQIEKQAKRLVQERRERHEQAQAKGRNTRKAQIAGMGRIKNRIELNSAKGRSERTQKKIIVQSERKINQVDQRIQDAREKIEHHQPLNINLSSTQVPNGKMILEIKNLSFQYPQHPKKIFENFSLHLQGPERVAILGDNGSGKTTLIKLILGEYAPVTGSITLGTQRVNYLDQKLQMLSPELSVLDNFLHLNPDITDLDARYYLADFLFRNDAALKLVKHLSGGERLRAALACILMSSQPPQLLILDEPTNHLDLYTIATIESALQNYQGALIVITHDMTFLKNIDINRIIKITIPASK